MITEENRVVAASPAVKKVLRPIAFACDENYAPYLPVVVRSLIDNSSEAFQYEIIILDCSVGTHFKLFTEMLSDLRKMLTEKPNFSIKSFKIRSILEQKDFLQKNKTALERYGYATYARLLIPDLLADYEKVLYLDIDHIILDDVAKIFDVSLGENIIAAVPDITVAAIRLGAGIKRKNFVEKKLGLSDDNYYIVASPMLFNIRACRDFNFTEKVLEVLSQDCNLSFPDQDVINAVCKGKIFPLPQKWGLMNTPNYELYRDFIKRKDTTGKIFSLFKKKEEPAIIHYVTAPKPWKGLETKYADLWWRYAVKTKNSTNLLFSLLFPFTTLHGYEGFVKIYKILGIPFLTVKTLLREKQYLLWKLPIIKKKSGKENYYIYILGMKVFSIRTYPV